MTWFHTGWSGGGWEIGRGVAVFATVLQVISSVSALTSSHQTIVHGLSWCLLQHKLKVARLNEKLSRPYMLIQLLYAITWGGKQMEQINHIGFVTVIVIEPKDFGLCPA